MKLCHSDIIKLAEERVRRFNEYKSAVNALRAEHNNNTIAAGNKKTNNTAAETSRHEKAMRDIISAKDRDYGSADTQCRSEVQKAERKKQQEWQKANQKQAFAIEDANRSVNSKLGIDMSRGLESINGRIAAKTDELRRKEKSVFSRIFGGLPQLRTEIEKLDEVREAYRQELRDIERKCHEEQDAADTVFRNSKASAEAARDSKKRSIDDRVTREQSAENTRYREKTSSIQREYDTEVRASKTRMDTAVEEKTKQFIEEFKAYSKKVLIPMELISNASILPVDNYQVPDRAPKYVVLGRYQVGFEHDSDAEFKSVLEKMLATDSTHIRRNGSAYYLDIPYVQDIRDMCSMVIHYESKDNDAVLAFFQFMLLRIVMQYPVGNLHLSMFDPLNNANSFNHLVRIFGGRANKAMLIDGGVHNVAENIKRSIASLNQWITNINAQYRDDLKTRYEEEAVRIFAATDFPQGFDRGQYGDLRSIARSVRTSGLGMYICMEKGAESELEANGRELLKEIRDVLINVSLGRTGGRVSLSLMGSSENGQIILEDYAPMKAKLGDILHKISSTEIPTVRRSLSILYPGKDIMQPRNWRQGRTDYLNVPFGVVGAGEIVSAPFGLDTYTHMLVGGSPRAGKSWFLHDIIINILINYSPDTVELYLLDFKEGVEFSSYGEYYLPSIRVAAVNSVREFGLSILKRIEEEFDERTRLFDESAKTTIVDYNEWAVHTDKPRMKRIVVIFDEFEQLMHEEDGIQRECYRILFKLTDMVAAVGIHFIFATQNFTVCGRVQELFRNKFHGRVAMRGAMGVMAEDSEQGILNSYGRSNVLYNANCGEAGMGTIVRTPSVCPTDMTDSFVKNLLHKMSDFYSAKENKRLYGDLKTFLVSKNITLDSQYPINRWIKGEEPESILDEDENCGILLGNAYESLKHAVISFSDEDGQNMAIVSPKKEVVLETLKNIIISFLYESIAVKNKGTDGPKVFILDANRRRNDSLYFFDGVSRRIEYESDVTKLPAFLGKIPFDSRAETLEEQPQVLFIITGTSNISLATRHGIHSVVWSEVLESLEFLMPSGGGINWMGVFVKRLGIGLPLAEWRQFLNSGEYDPEKASELSEGNAVFAERGEDSMVLMPYKNTTINWMRSVLDKLS